METKKLEFAIPKGCRRVEIDHESGVVIMHVEEEKVEFKRGDIISRPEDPFSIHTIAIFDSNGSNIHICGYNNSCGFVENIKIDISEYRHATPEEKQLLFDKLEEEGYKWNSETLELEKIEKFEKG